MKKGMFAFLFMIFTLSFAGATGAFAVGGKSLPDGTEQGDVVIGVVKNLNETAKTFDVVTTQGKTTVVEVTAETTFDLERGKNIDASTDTTFKGLDEKDMVQVRGVEADGRMTAKHIEIYRE